MCLFSGKGTFYIKQVLISTMVTLPKFALPFKIYTVASEDSVVGVLAQDMDGLERVKAYASQALTHTQKWSTFDRKLWAIVWVVCEFKHYGGLSVFTILKDNRPLLGLRHLIIDISATRWWASGL